MGVAEGALAALVHEIGQDPLVIMGEGCAMAAHFQTAFGAGAGEEFEDLGVGIGEKPFVELFAVFFGQVHQNVVGPGFFMMNVLE